MKQFEVFQSDGGWRVAGSVYAGGPVLANSPWFATREEAEAAAERMEAKAKAELAEWMERSGISEADLRS